MRDKRLIAVSLALASLVGASAFAESRPSDETRRRDEGRETIRRERGTERRGGDEWRNSERSERGGERRTYELDERPREGRTYERNDRPREGRTYERNDRPREGRTYERNDRSREGRTYERDGRGDDRRYDERRGSTYRRDDSRADRYEHRSHGDRRHYYHRGRVSNYQRYGNGYRVWVAGAPYPFFVPLSHWHRDRFRIGVTIGIGGYYNPGGYYDYYDDYRGYDRSYSRGVLRGVVESVDYRRDTFVVRNEATGSFVTVRSRDRRYGIRAGDFVEVRGDWTRSGLFTAWDVDLLDRW